METGVAQQICEYVHWSKLETQMKCTEEKDVIIPSEKYIIKLQPYSTYPDSWIKISIFNTHVWQYEWWICDPFRPHNC